MTVRRGKCNFEYYRMNGVVWRRLRAYVTTGTGIGHVTGTDTGVDFNLFMRCTVGASF